MKKNLLKKTMIAFVLFALAINVNAQVVQETRVSKTIKMFDFLNKAVIDGAQAKGGLHSVADKTARLALKKHLRTEGMLVVQLDNDAIWRLTANPGTVKTTDADWVELGVMEVYDANKLYTAGDVVMFNNIPEVCIKTITNKEAHDATKWRTLGEVKRFPYVDIDARNSATNVFVIGDIAVVDDCDKNTVTKEKGIYLYDGTTWITISEEGVKGPQAGTFYHGVCDSKVLVEATLITLTSVKDQTKAVLASTPVDFTTKGFFTFAYPADWTTKPAVYVTEGVDPNTNTSRLTDCWNEYFVTIDSREYRVFTINVDFSAATTDLKFEIR